VTAAPRGVARATARTKRVAWLVVNKRGHVEVVACTKRKEALMWCAESLGERVVRVEYEWPARAGRSRMGGAL